MHILNKIRPMRNRSSANVNVFINSIINKLVYVVSYYQQSLYLSNTWTTNWGKSYLAKQLYSPKTCFVTSWPKNVPWHWTSYWCTWYDDISVILSKISSTVVLFLDKKKRLSEKFISARGLGIYLNPPFWQFLHIYAKFSPRKMIENKTFHFGTDFGSRI